MSPPVIDGVLDDPCWADCEVADQFFDMSRGLPPTQPTSVSVCYDDRWTAEFAIPLSELRFAPGESVTWGAEFLRHQTQNREDSRWIHYEGEALDPAHFGDLCGIACDSAPHGLDIIVTAVSRYDEADLHDYPLEPEDADWDLHPDAGLDVEWVPLPTLTTSATINPDFAQIEGDPNQINLTGDERQLDHRRVRQPSTPRAERSRGPRAQAGRLGKHITRRLLHRPRERGRLQPRGGVLSTVLQNRLRLALRGDHTYDEIDYPDYPTETTGLIEFTTNLGAWSGYIGGFGFGEYHNSTYYSGHAIACVQPHERVTIDMRLQGVFLRDYEDVGWIFERVRSDLMITRDSFVRLFAQGANIRFGMEDGEMRSQRYDLNLLYGWEFSPGSMFYLAYNQPMERASGENDWLDPVLVAKLSYMFGL